MGADRRSVPNSQAVPTASKGPLSSTRATTKAMDDTARRNTTTAMPSSKVPVRDKSSSGGHQLDHSFHAPTVRAAISAAQSRSVGRRRKDLFQASVRRSEERRVGKEGG